MVRFQNQTYSGYATPSSSDEERAGEWPMKLSTLTNSLSNQSLDTNTENKSFYSVGPSINFEGGYSQFGNDMESWGTKNYDSEGPSDGSAGGCVWGLKSTQDIENYENVSLYQQISPRRDRNSPNSFRSVKPDAEYQPRSREKNKKYSKHCYQQTINKPDAEYQPRSREKNNKYSKHRYQQTINTRPEESILTMLETQGVAEGKQNFPNQSTALETIKNDSNKFESLLSLLQWENCLLLTPKTQKYRSIQSPTKSSSFANTTTMSGVPKDYAVEESSTVLNNIEYYPYEPGEGGHGVSLFPVFAEDVMLQERTEENFWKSRYIADCPRRKLGHLDQEESHWNRVLFPLSDPPHSSDE